LALPTALFIGTIIVLGALSVRQHNRLEQLTRIAAQQGRTQRQSADQLVEQMVSVQKSVTRQIEQSRHEIFKKFSGYQQQEKILAALSEGVCLIQGQYIFIDPRTDRQLRYAPGEDPPALDSTPALLSPPENDAAAVNAKQFFPVSLDGAGKILTVHYTGTGFLIDRRGHIFTNKHVTRPWEVSQEYRHILEAGYEGRLSMFRAFFPGRANPFDLHVLACSDQQDVALLYTDLKGTDIPPLPCAAEPTSLRAGETVMVLGYPTGFDLLLARLSEAELKALMPDNGISFDRIAEIISSKGLIYPVATRGMCGRVSHSRIAYDAQTALGGSGGPVIGPRGNVVAINTALLKGFSGTNFGIPIRYAQEFWRRTVQTQKEPAPHHVPPKM